MDRAVLLWMVAHRTGWATASARALMALGTRPVPLAAAGLVALVLVAVSRSWRLGATAAAAAVAAAALSVGAKLVVHPPRPAPALSLVTAHGSAMPSTDAALTAAAAVVLVVGVALVYLGAHWTTDVLVGWALGAAVGAALAPRGRGLLMLQG